MRSDRVDLSDPAQVDRYLSARVRAEGDCWVWALSLNNQGYGVMQTTDFSGLAHRFSYEYHRAEIPEGLHIDHLCHNRRCINPWHLEPVTQAENNRRAHATRTECPAGHPFSDENRRGSGKNSYCRPCHNDREMARRKRLKEIGVKRYWERGATAHLSGAVR